MFSAATAPVRACAPGLFLFLAACGADPELAVVNGKAIRASELERQVLVYQSVRPEAPADGATRRLVLEQLIRQELLASEARRAGLDKDLAFREALNRRRVQLSAELKAAIQRSQVQLENLDSALETKALIDRLYAERGAGKAVSQAEVAAAYKARREQAAGAALAPLKEMEAQLREQLGLEKLVAAARQGAKIQVHEERIP